MRKSLARLWFGAGIFAGVVSALIYWVIPANAVSGANKAWSGSITCPGPQAYSPDGGSGKATGKINAACPEGHLAIELENETSNAVYIGACPYGAGGVGCMTSGNYTVVGKKRCASACTFGGAFSADLSNSGPLYCVNGLTTDAGVTLSVLCAR